MPFKDKQKRLEYHREYNREYMKRTRKENLSKFIERDRKWRENNPIFNSALNNKNNRF